MWTRLLIHHITSRLVSSAQFCNLAGVNSLGVCSWQKMTVRFSVRFCKKLRFSVRFPFYKINRGFVFFGSVRPTFVCRRRRRLSFTPLWYDARNDVQYFRAELVQLIVSRSDSELEVQRHGMKKNTLTVDPISCCKMNCEWDNVKNRPKTDKVVFLKTKPQKPSFQFLNFEVGLVRFLENRYPTFLSGSAHPYNSSYMCWHSRLTFHLSLVK